MEQKFFENKIKPILLWMGTIVSVIMSIAYIIVVFVLIEGFNVDTLLNTTIFSIVTAIIGFCIMQMLKIQGQTFAQNLPENKEIIDKYNRTKTNEKKARPMKHFWVKSVVCDVLVKCLTLGITTIGIVYIMIEGSGNYNLLFLAAVNLLMFAGFGLISLVKAYDFFNNSYIPYMLEKLDEKAKEQIDTKRKNKKFQSETVVKKNLEMVKEKYTKQRDNSICTNSGSDILDSSMGSSADSINN